MTNYPKEPLIKTLMEQDSAINATGITFYHHQLRQLMKNNI